ncbi:CocE/NonD family hydrolase [Aquimarina hainanensis]|uniref:CocE/NonD family hydrolase n=1 Tax=Aquimarina hainanensis TaxID=1578017 RepID=A0ABW5N3C5_9FLAO
MKNIFLSFVFIFISSNLTLFAQSTDSLDIHLKLYQKIKMTDATQLSANIYMPNDLSKKYPTVLIITPYVSDENHVRGLFFARNEYVFVTVDCRGRGNSEGTFIPFEHDGKDGYEIINWIAQQSWNDGNIGMFGGSYRGMNQWLTLKQFPKNLKTIIPIASVGPGRDFPKYNNIFFPYMLRWLTFTSGKTRNGKLFGNAFWQIKQEALYKKEIPFYAYDSIVGTRNKVFQKWLSHPAHDTFWQSFYLTPEENNKIQIPILSITGHFDADQPGAMLYYNDHMKHGNPRAVKNHFLLIGPWSHGGTRSPKSKFGGLTFGENAVIDMNQLYLDWFNWTLKGKEKPAILKNRVMYYEMGTNQWEYTTDLTLLSNEQLSLYLESTTTNARDLFSSGTLTTSPPAKDILPDSIIYDPLTKKGIDNPSYQDTSSNYYTSQSYTNDANQLVYHSAPLSKNITVNGKISFEAYISIDVPDTDFMFTAYEITTDNTSIFLQKDYLRARYRNNLEKAQKVPKNEIVKYTFDGENLFSRVLKKGSRIRLIFSTIDSPEIQKNYNSWTDPSVQSGKHAQKAHIKLYHNKKYPSRLILPVKTIKK